MRYYVLSYDLRGHVMPEDYTRLAQILQTAPDCCKPLLSFWIVGTTLAPAQIIANLRASNAIVARDGIVVLEITGRGDFFGIETADAQAWLASRIIKA
ncbi:hypothetical protein [Brevundimonas sp. TWP2-3-2]|uniref:hypothetical protein n=1 Tax=unclassified Brevundimonas TaxID=2622653 RepID=UPI003CF71BC7